MKMIIYILAHGDTNQESRPKKLDSIMSPDSFFFLSLQSIFTTCIALFLLDIQRYVQKTKKETVEEFNTSGVLRTVSSAKIPPIVTDMKIKKVGGRR